MYNLMICEDEVCTLEMLNKGIEWFKYNVEVKALEVNGQNGLNAFHLHSFDIILADIKMPVMSGIEMARRIREIDKRVRIIFLTSLEEFEYAKAAVNVDASGYILKPYRREDLISAINKAVEQLKLYGNSPSEETHTAECDEGTNENFIVSAINDYIHENIDKKLSIHEISEFMGYSANYLGQLYKKNTGMFISEYIIHIRMECAVQLLGVAQNQISAVALRLGYQDTAYFIKQFRDYYGITPKVYRDKIMIK